MFNNLQDFKVKPFLNMFLSLTKPYMDFSKLLELGMKN